MERTFVIQMNDEYGFRGGVPKDAHDSWIPLNELGVVHDFMEHSSGVESAWSPEEECRALGVVLWGRACGDFFRTSTPQRSLASDFSRMALERSIPEYRWSRPLKDHYAESVLNEAISEAQEIYRTEREDWDAEVIENYPTVRSMNRFRGWVRYGYRWAEKTYGKHFSPKVFSNIFVALEIEVAEILKREPEEGDELVLKLDFDTKRYGVIYTSRYDLEENYEDEEEE